MNTKYSGSKFISFASIFLTFSLLLSFASCNRSESRATSDAPREPSSAEPEESASEVDYFALATQYAKEVSIDEHNELQKVWFSAAKMDPDDTTYFTDARVDRLTYHCDYRGYTIFRYTPAFAAEDPSKVFEVGGFCKTEDGWFADDNCVLLAFISGENPEPVFTFHCEFSYPHALFLQDADRAIDERIAAQP